MSPRWLKQISLSFVKCERWKSNTVKEVLEEQQKREQKSDSEKTFSEEEETLLSSPGSHSV